MKVKEILNKSIISGTALLLSSCATIISSSKYDVSVNSKPSGSEFRIQNRKGLQVYSGKTPANITLSANSGYFKKESYQVIFPNYNKTIPISCSVDGAYIANLLFGGPLGFLIIDPVTGAMYKLDKGGVYPTLSEKNQDDENDSASQKDEESNEIHDKKELMDVVYLKDGSIIHGKIVKIKPGKQVKIETESGNVFVYEMSEVKKIAKEKAPK